MTDQEKSAGGKYRVIDLKNSKYQLHTKAGGAVEGTFKSVFKHGIKMGVKFSELEFAFLELERTGDTVAEFGVLGNFLFTHTRSIAA